MKAKTKAPSSLFDFLKDTIGTASANRIRKMIKHGRVKVDGRIILRPDEKLRKGQTVEVTREKTSGKVKKAASQVFPHKVLFEDKYLVAIEKPAGLLASGKSAKGRPTFAQQVIQHFQFKKENPCQTYPVKRLERELSGIMIFAKSEKLKERLRRAWDNDTEIRYCALIEGRLREPEGTLKHFLQRKKFGVAFIGGKNARSEQAITVYKELKRFTAYSLVELRPKTSLKYQVRAQLAEVRHPIVGDKIYGTTENPIGRIALHLHHISLNHPITKKRLKITTPIPKQFIQFAKNHA
ncbi:MAG: RluA family pseudouridine synthase [Bacteroidota bacterium]